MLNYLNSGIASRGYVKPVPAMWLSTMPLHMLSSSEWTWNVGVEYNDAIYIIGRKSTGTRGAYLWKYDATNGWVEKTAGTAINGTDPDDASCYCFFIASNGYLYTSFLRDAVAGNIWRSVDDGVTWTSVQTLATTTAGTYLWSMTEDNLGYIYGGVYRSGAPADGSEVALYQSKDNGATFTDIASKIDVTGRKHIHQVYFCQYRKTLFVLTGDKGASDSIHYSTDNGETFTKWNIGQMITVTTDATNIYMAAEITSALDTSIYRASEVGGAITKVHALAVSDGFCWQGHVNDFGQVYFMVSSAAAAKAQMLVSDDKGDTWHDVYPQTIEVDGNTAAVNDGQDYQRRGILSAYAAKPNFHYNEYKQWRAYPGEHEFLIDESNGEDYLFSKGAINTIPDVGVNAHMRIKLAANYSAPYSPAIDGLIINKDSFSFSNVQSGTLAADEGFEGTGLPAGFSTSAQNAGDLDYDSVTQVNSGTQSLQIATTGSFAAVRKAAAFSGITSGQTAWISGYYYYDSASAPTSDVMIMSCSAVSIYHRTNGYLSARTVGGTLGNFRQLSSAVLFPRQQFVNVKLEVYAHASLGYVRVTQNGETVVYATGLNTLSLSFGNADWANTGMVGLTAYWDDIKASIDFDPDKPTTPALNGLRQALLPDGVYT